MHPNRAFGGVEIRTNQQCRCHRARGIGCVSFVLPPRHRALRKRAGGTALGSGRPASLARAVEISTRLRSTQIRRAETKAIFCDHCSNISMGVTPSGSETIGRYLCILDAAASPLACSGFAYRFPTRNSFSVPTSTPEGPTPVGIERSRSFAPSGRPGTQAPSPTERERFSPAASAQPPAFRARLRSRVRTARSASALDFAYPLSCRSKLSRVDPIRGFCRSSILYLLHAPRRQPEFFQGRRLRLLDKPMQEHHVPAGYSKKYSGDSASGQMASCFV